MFVLYTSMSECFCLKSCMIVQNKQYKNKSRSSTDIAHYLCDLIIEDIMAGGGSEEGSHLRQPRLSCQLTAPCAAHALRAG